MNEAHMRRALALAQEKMQAGEGGPFGAVIVRGEGIIAEGWNRVLATNDPTAHAEVVAIREATRKTGHYHLTGCVLYTSCEPCPMCLGAAYWAQVDAVYFSVGRDYAESAGFSDRFIYEELARELDLRKLKIRQLLPEEGKAPFAAWRAKADRVVY